MTFSVATLLGPGLAGLVAMLADAPAAMALSIAGGRRRLRGHFRRTRGDRPALRRQLRAGFRANVASRSLACATATSMVSYVGVGMAVIC
jgi:hypothetical protein